MMMLLETYVRRWRRVLRKCWTRPGLRFAGEMIGCFLGGLFLSAASLGNQMQPFGLGVLCAGVPGWLPIPFALGGGLGYWLFWGKAGMQGIIWLAAGLPVCVLLGQKKAEISLLKPSLATLIVAACGVIFQIWQGDDTTILMYLLRVLLAFGSTWLMGLVRQRQDPAADWVAMAIGVLALAQIAPLRFLDLGLAAGGLMALAMPFPAVAMAGLALDLAQITAVPMTAVLCLSYFLQMLPRVPKKYLCIGPSVVFLLIMGLCGKWDFAPLPALMLGGALSLLSPRCPKISHRRGETGFAQVRLEMAACVLEQSEQVLEETENHPIDERALMAKAADRACSSCPCHKSCKDLEAAQNMPESLLHSPVNSADDLPVSCKKRGRLLTEVRRSQDQYRAIKADRDRQQEYRSAIIQQYRFLSEYLQDLADKLPQRGKSNHLHYQPEVAVCSSGKESANGDRCLWFAGTEGKYYLLLCDGMGTGAGAAEEAKSAGNMLRRLLMAGYPAQYALRSLNSLCTLRGRAGAVTVDLAEIYLDSGKANIYKWGAAPSYLLLRTGPERIGTTGAPPGLSVTDFRETVDRVSLRRGESLVLLSDGVDDDASIHRLDGAMTEAPGELASRILELGSSDGSDDATVAVVRLMPMISQR